MGWLRDAGKRLRRAVGAPAKLIRLDNQVRALALELEQQAVAIGRLHSSINAARQVGALAEVEFKVFSQYGDDGIVSYLADRVQPEVKRFVGFGVEDYRESNTRFLLVARNWSGLVLDGRPDLSEVLRADPIFRRHDLRVRPAFVTAENINSLLCEEGFEGDIGLLSIDIDGNDYWVWRAIKVVRPAIVISEFNSVFGPTNPWTVPYDSAFVRARYHSSNLVYGSSLTSLCDLAREREYAFVGCNSAGNNAYFVREDACDLRSLTPEEGYVESKFSESRDRAGKWTFLKGKDRLASLRGVEVFNTRTASVEVIS